MSQREPANLEVQYSPVTEKKIVEKIRLRKPALKLKMKTRRKKYEEQKLTKKLLV